MVIWMQKGGVTKEVEDYNITKFEKLGFKKIVEEVKEVEVEEILEVEIDGKEIAQALTEEVKTKKKVK